MRNFKEELLNYLQEFGSFEKRSMFGGTGIFINSAMYAIITDKALYLRGGDALDEQLVALGCEKFRHIKRSTTAVVNYYDITDIYHNNLGQCSDLVKESISLSITEKEYKLSDKSKRIRDLPNMRLTLERMVKKAGIPDVSSFISLGAVEVFRKVRQSQGKDLDVKLLWMFAGAIDGCHWTLLKDDQKQRLLQAID
ncbi:TfoX/Sxy family DNA transformation protein [Photobacterium aphoticum]|uniref:DNA transformation protein n=2 Tax=Photobacterium aphoticum TaxID=754436 RepID=A0A0J1GTF2_9GAMM|nr:TfoX/Sxy family DNA transformation protein [Photobacterium aphoticum]KLV03003.1 DNA transformation protein [Photobacterium aphoticum]PSU57879.1 DNA transformation protein [Photobacterium aphoticum]